MIKEINDFDILNKLFDYNFIKNDFNKIIGYYLNDNLIAFVDYSKMYERIEINYIYVLEQYRKKKIGYNLLKSVIDNNKFENITLEVNVNNIGAISLYQKLNFKIIGKRLKYYNGIDAYLMERR